MNTKLFLLLSLLFILGSCDKAETISDLKLSRTEFTNLSPDGESVAVDLACSISWTAHSEAAWCKLNVNSGTGSIRLVIKVDPNLETNNRTANLTITSGGSTQTITISQLASAGGEHHYRLPVIFHVLYQNANDETQFVRKGRMAEVLNRVNRYYRDHVNSVNMNFEFVLAATDPNGNPLEEPGVERIRYERSYPIDARQFMTDDKSRYKYLLWDPNEYINVMVYHFGSDVEGYIMLGISHLPFTSRNHFLPGTSETDFEHITLENLTYAHCLSINSRYIYEEIGEYTNTANIHITTAHELGHYLGLLHTFTEEDDPNIDDTCRDTDYCTDTPSYNRKTYEAWMKEAEKRPGIRFSDLAMRTNCGGQSYVSRNLMDYVYCYSDQFTPDQRSRVRHVLNYSPLIPGPKMGDSRTRTVVKGKLDLPIRVIR